MKSDFSISFKIYLMATTSIVSKDTIQVIDCTDFHQCTPNNYKEIPITEAIPAEPQLQFSRYEILDTYCRKVYFDFDGIPDDGQHEDIPDKFVKEWVRWMHSKGFLKTEDVKYVKTTNHASTAHKGFSAHVILWEYMMDITQLKNSIILFTNTIEEGKPFREYVDIRVYTSLRLFKLPNFIGIPMTDVNNYHRMDPNDLEPTHYIIQLIKDATLITAYFKMPRGLLKSAKKQGHSQTNAKYYAQLAEILQHLEQVFVEKKSKVYNEEDLGKELQSLIDNPNVKEEDKNILRKYLPIKADTLPLVNSFVTLVKSKYHL